LTRKGLSIKGLLTFELLPIIHPYSIHSRA